MKGQRGQSSVEYIIVCAALISALLVEVPSDDAGRNVIEICSDEIRDWYKAFSYSKSLPTLPY